MDDVDVDSVRERMQAIDARREKWRGPPRFWLAPTEPARAPAPLQAAINAAAAATRAVARTVGLAVPAWAAAEAAPRQQPPFWAPGQIVLALDPAIVAGSDEHAALERAAAAAGVRIAEKHSSALEDSLVVEPATDEPRRPTSAPPPSELVAALATLPGVRSAAPRPVPRALAVRALAPRGSAGENVIVFSGADTTDCNAAAARRAATKADSLPVPLSLLRNAAPGTLIIVWDFVPDDGAERMGDDLARRAGGAPVWYQLSTGKRGWHGSSVASVCCGASGGLAGAARLAVVGLGPSLTSDLAVIREILRAFAGPAVINMSFSLEYAMASDAERAQVALACADLDAHVAALIAEFPRTVFVAAAGNENMQVCDRAGTLGVSGALHSWPQYRAGADAGPFLLVGATEAGAIGGLTTLGGTPSVSRALASYSNYGRCVSLLAQGGWCCAYRPSDPGAPFDAADNFKITHGTSVASPLVAALLVMQMAARGGTGAQAVAALREAAENGTVSGGGSFPLVAALPGEQPNAFAVLPLDAVAVPAADTGAAEPGTGSLPDPSLVDPQPTLDPPVAEALSTLTLSATSSALEIVLAALMIAAFVAIAAFLVRIVARREADR
jgi:hypothetical protein